MRWGEQRCSTALSEGLQCSMGIQYNVSYNSKIKSTVHHSLSFPLETCSDILYHQRFSYTLKIYSHTWLELPKAQESERQLWQLQVSTLTARFLSSLPILHIDDGFSWSTKLFTYNSLYSTVLVSSWYYQPRNFWKSYLGAFVELSHPLFVLKTLSDTQPHNWQQLIGTRQSLEIPPCSAVFVPRRSWQITTRLETEPVGHTERITKAGPPVSSQQACMRALSFVKAGDPITTIKPSPGWLCCAKRRLGVKSFYPLREQRLLMLTGSALR